jgi:Spy/CpxP family protein refolding chaperone
MKEEAMRNSAAIRLTLVLLCLATLSFAQAPGRDFFPWWDMPLARDLNLSDDQMKQIRATAREFRDRIIDLRAGMEKADNALNDLMEEDRPDQQKLYAAIDHLVNARGELTRVFSQMAVRMRMILTPQQWRELQRRRPRPVMQPDARPNGPALNGPLPNGPLPNGPRNQPKPPRPIRDDRPLDREEGADRGNIENAAARILDRPY